MNTKRSNRRLFNLPDPTKKAIATKFADPEKFLPELNPTSVYMAGSPGAGKTEVSICLIDAIKQYKGSLKILRIDPDELRSNFEDYTGNNA